MYYYDTRGDISAIDKKIAYLQAQKNALINGYCFTGAVYESAAIGPCTDICTDVQETSEVDNEVQRKES